MIELIRAHDYHHEFINVITDDSIPLKWGMPYVFYSDASEQWEYFTYTVPVGILMRKAIIMFLP